jgi:type II secretory pathway component PulF
VIWLVFTGLVVHIGFGVITPAMERVFQDFKLDLPGVTMAWIGLSRAFIGGGWMAWWALVLGGATLLIIFRPPEKAEGRSAGWIVLLLALRYGWVFIAAVGVVSMALPYLSLVESVTSPKP